ncbi:DUF5711 family protein [Lachnospiraceae bacterium LCP25S3_G4]
MRQNGIVELRIAEPIANLEEKIKKHKHMVWKLWICRIIVAVMVVGGTYLLREVQTYNKARVLTTYGDKSSANNSYVNFGDQILKYGRDGVSLLNMKGEEQWNYPYQIKSPLVEISDNAIAIGDNGGNQIQVFQKKGLKGEIQTTSPIEKIAVSNQGIVAAILKDDVSPKIMCYDATGNVLVKHEVSLKRRGYPTDISISKDGKMLLVTYLFIENESYTTKVAYYNFDKVGQDETDNQVNIKEYKETIMPSAFFLNDTTSIVVGDDSFVIYKGTQIPEEKKRITLKKKIKSVVHSNKYIGFVLKNDGEGYELRVYGENGKQVMSKDFTGDYSNIQISGKQIVMFEGSKCNIYTVNGVNRFKGEVETNIQGMLPIAGANKYVMMNANGIEEIRLVK